MVYVYLLQHHIFYGMALLALLCGMLHILIMPVMAFMKLSQTIKLNFLTNQMLSHEKTIIHSIYCYIYAAVLCNQWIWMQGEKQINHESKTVMCGLIRTRTALKYGLFLF